VRRCDCCRELWPDDKTCFRYSGGRLLDRTCRACWTNCDLASRVKTERRRAVRHRVVTGAGRRRILLGPVPCRGCGKWVTWNGYEWQDGRGRHSCQSVAVAA
jgi:hypothetical protein